MSQRSNDSSRADLDEINDNEVLALLPETFFLSVLLVLGLIGNGFVLFVYGFKFTKTSRRFYTLCLSVADFFTCGVGISLHIAMNILPYKFENGIVCKIFWFPSTVSVLISGLLLVVIGIDRYMKVCHPFETQLSLKSTRRVCAFVLLFSTILSIPAAIMYGRSHIPTEVGNMTGSTCDIQDYYKKTQYPKLYNMSLFVVFCVCFLSLVVFYVLISREMQNYEKKANSLRRTVNRNPSFVSGRTPVLHQTDKSARITRMFLVLTIFGMVSFVPCLVAHALKNYSGGNITSDQYRLYSIIYNSFFINTVANPFLYGFYDTVFRRHLRNMFRRWQRTVTLVSSHDS